MAETDKALAERLAAGDEEAFDAVYRAYAGKLYRMAYFISGNKSDSEDILQETFVKCFLHRGELKQPERLESWLYQILVRTAWRSEKKKKNKRELSFDGFLEDQESGAGERIRMDRADGPLTQILEAERSEALWRAVSRLDARHRTVVLLYYYNDMTTKEIARTTGTLEGTVKSRLHKARALLRRELELEEAERIEKGRLCHE